MTETRLCSTFQRLLFIAAFALPFHAATSTAPQLPNPGNAHMSKQDQEKLGEQAVAEVYKQMPVLPDSSPITQYVQQLGRKLEKQIPAENSWPYQFHVIQQKEINAFALPGGPIFINVGTINAAQNEAQLAGVMSHEMSHVYMQHSAKRATSPKEQLAEMLGAVGGMLGNSTLGSLAGLGIRLTAGSMLLKYSREDEAQADAVGAVIMHKAEYNPTELARFFEVLAKQGNGGPQFLSDHPNPGNRSQAIEREIRAWPKQNYLGDSAAFRRVKDQAQQVRAYTGQEISDGAKQGIWAQQNMKNGAVPESAQSSIAASAEPSPVHNVTFDQVRPSDQFTEVRQAGFTIQYPANWATATGENSLSIAPKAGVGHNSIAYGVLISPVEDASAGSIDQVATDLVQNLTRTNPGMRQEGQPTAVSVNGAQGRQVDLVSNSPVVQNGKPLAERDQLVVAPRSGGSYLYLIFIAPDKDFRALAPTYQKMLGSLRAD
jgi:beta-barrel assembly-enhancing protease